MPDRSRTNPGNPRRGGGALKRWLQSHRRVAHSSAQQLLTQPVSSLLTVFVIAVSLLLPALLFALNTNIAQLLSEFRQDTQISLYLADDVSEERGLQVSEDLLTRSDISSVDYISKARGLAEFSTAAGLSDVLAQLPDNPLPAAIAVTPARAEPAAVVDLAADLGAIPEIELVRVDSQWLQRLAAVSRLIAVVGSGLTIIVVLGLFVIVGNTIKLAIENRRREISVIKLVGGTNGFIARPLLYAGLYYGGAGGVLAIVLQQVVLATFNVPLQELLSLYGASYSLQGLGLTGAATVILAGAAIGWSAALLASLRHIWSLEP